MRRVAVTLLFGLTAFARAPAAHAECGNQIPPWLAQDLTGRLLKDKSQTYFVGRATAATEQDARVLARKDAESQIARCNFLTIGSKSRVKQELHVATADGKTSEQSTVEGGSEVTTTAHAQAIGVREVTSFACQQKGSVAMTVVVTVPRNQLPPACGQTVSYPTPTDFLWRSALLPSWGQFHKGDSATAYTILFTEVLTIPTAVFAGIASREARDNATASTVQGDREVYNQRADTLFYLSAGAAAVSVGMYVFNVLNAYSGTPSYGLGETRTGGAKSTGPRVVLSDKVGLALVF